MKKERLQSEADYGPQAYGHDSTVGFVFDEYPLPAKFSPAVNRMTQKSQDVVLYAETVKRQPDQQRQKQISYDPKLSHHAVLIAFCKLRAGEKSSRRNGINKPQAP